MNLVRKNIRLSEDGQVQRDMSDEAFWNGVVADTAALLETGRVSNSRLNWATITNHYDIYRSYRQLSLPIK
jgi:hypothetical protein